MKLPIAIALLAVTACSNQASTPPPQPPPPEQPSNQPAPTSEPTNHHTCQLDSDCTLAPTISGWATTPPTGATCENSCFAAINKASEAAWAALVETLSPTITCDREFEPCPPESDFTAACVESVCTARYSPQQ